MADLNEADRALLTQATERARARVALQQIQETGDSQREAKARARMSGRTIDETGRDVNERQPEPEPEALPDCVHCNGTGQENDPDYCGSVGSSVPKCKWCNGSGKRKRMLEKPEPEPIQPGWYWTGTHVVWVVGPTVNGRGAYFQTSAGPDWAPMRITAHWQRVHEQVRESGQGFGWRPPAPNH